VQFFINEKEPEVVYVVEWNFKVRVSCALQSTTEIVAELFSKVDPEQVRL
jgi:hypothetical protein